MIGSNDGTNTKEHILKNFQKQLKESKNINVTFICDHNLQEYKLYVGEKFIETIRGSENIERRMLLLNSLNVQFDIED